MKKGSSSASKFRVMSFNANSIGKNPKRRQVLHFLSKKNPDFIFVIDTRICPTIENVINEEWEGDCIFSSLNSQSRGIALFIKRGTLAEVLNKRIDKEGNILAVLVKIDGKKF